jgi:ABC-type proline/glycine betaine transport system permease subunit
MQIYLFGCWRKGIVGFAIVKAAVVVLCLAGIVAGYILLKKKKNGENPEEDNDQTAKRGALKDVPC